MEEREGPAAEQRYRELFEEAPISLWEEDFSQVKSYLDRLRAEGVADFLDHFTRTPEAFIKCAHLVRVIDVNRHTLRLFGAGSKQELYDNLRLTVPPEAHAFFLEQLLAIADGKKTFQGQTVNLTLQGEKLDLFLKWTVSPDSHEDYSRILVAVVDETERVAAERSLKAAMAEWRDTFDSVRDIIFILDGGFRVVRSNAASERFFGMSGREIAGRHCYELMHGSREPVEGCPLVAMAESGGHQEAELRLENHGIWAQITVDPVYGEDGSLTGVVHIVKDITVRKRAEESLKESERLYRMLADNTQDLICVCDTDLVRRYVSPSYETVLGYKPEELTDISLFSQVPPGEEEPRKDEFRRTVIEGFSGTVRQRLRHKDGHYVWIDTKASVLHGVDGEVAGYLIASRDVDRQAEAEEILRREREQLLSIFDSINQVIYVCDPLTYEVLYVNKAMREAFGRDLVGGLCYREFQGFEEPCGFCTNPIILGDRTEPYVWEYHNPVTDRDYMLVDRIIAWPPDGREARFELAVDITERKRAEEALRETNEQLKGFLSVAAHELRHPINLVQGYVGTLMDLQGESDPEMLDEIYAGIRRASGRLVRLVEELLEVSRIEQLRFTVKLETGEPRGLVEEAVGEMRVRGVANTFEIETKAGMETWDLDHDKFRQLMVILLENAVNYSPAGSPVEVEMEVIGEVLEVSVKDRGRGVDEEERERVFQRFYQVDDPRHHSVPGLGLGLYVASRIVEGHGGEIRHEDRPGGGSVFRFTLPRSSSRSQR